MSATLGGLIKDYRLQKNISQLEVAFALGWKEPSRLSRIEQGKVGKPKRALLEQIMDALRLEIQERNQLLLSGSYLPTEKEIQEVRKKTKKLLDGWRYPAILYDFSWRIITYNEKILETYTIDPKVKPIVDNNYTWLPELIFDPTFPQNRLNDKERSQWDRFLLEFIIRYRVAQRTRTKELWYVKLIQRLMRNPKFREFWMISQKSTEQIPVNFGMVNPTISTSKTNKQLNLYYSMIPLLNDPRFELELDTPADIETMKYFTNKS